MRIVSMLVFAVVMAIIMAVASFIIDGLLVELQTFQAEDRMMAIEKETRQAFRSKALIDCEQYMVEAQQAFDVADWERAIERSAKAFYLAGAIEDHQTRWDMFKRSRDLERDSRERQRSAFR